MDVTNTMLTALDHRGRTVAPGDMVKVLGVSPDPDMDDDDREMIEYMVGSICEVDRVDAHGEVWVTMWWNTGEGSATTSVALAPHQFEWAEAG